MKALLVFIPPLIINYPPPILSVLASCCEAVGVSYEVEDLNLHMKNSCDIIDTKLFWQLHNDLISGTFQSIFHRDQFDKICEHLTSKITSYSPDYICISVFSYDQIFSAYTILEKISKIKTNAKIVIGGSGVINPFKETKHFGLYCIDNQLADYCIFGDGENAFIELLKGNTTYPGINKLNQVQIQDLDSLPLPSYKKINISNYLEPLLIVHGSKGCVMDCTFCDIANIWPKYYYKSGKRLANELYKLWQETGVSNFYFSDSLINGSIKNFREMNKEIIKLKNNDSNFKPEYFGQFICRPSGQLTDSDYKEMSLAGAVKLVVGIESFSNSVRTHMRKKFDNQSIDDHLALCAKYGITNMFLLLSGYVTETLEDHKENLRYLEKYQMYALSEVISSLYFNIGGLELSSTHSGGVPLDSMSLGIIYRPDENDQSTRNWISLSNPDLTVKERHRRSTELLIHSINLGYKTQHVQEHLHGLEKYYQFLTTKKNDKKFIAIAA